MAGRAAGGVRDLDALIRVRDLGCTRCGTSATAAILDEYRRRAAGGGADGGSTPSPQTTERTPGGY